MQNAVFVISKTLGRFRTLKRASGGTQAHEPESDPHPTPHPPTLTRRTTPPDRQTEGGQAGGWADRRAGGQVDGRTSGRTGRQAEACGADRLPGQKVAGAKTTFTQAAFQSREAGLPTLWDGKGAGVSPTFTSIFAAKHAQLTASQHRRVAGANPTFYCNHFWSRG